MDDDGDEIVKNRRKSITMSCGIEAATANPRTARRNAILCERCRHFDHGWCSVKASRLPMRAEACDYGRRAIASEEAMMSFAKAKSAKAKKQKKRRR